jgi:hypothetical protein
LGKTKRAEIFRDKVAGMVTNQQDRATPCCM